MGCSSGVPIERPGPSNIQELDNAVQQGKAVLGYWNIRGMGQGLRYLLSALNVPFVDKRYEAKIKEDGSLDLSDWFDVKFKIGLEFANLPYIVDNDVKIAETIAVYIYLCRKHRPEYLGRNHVEAARAMAVYSVLAEFKKFYTQRMYYPQYANEDYKAQLAAEAKTAYGKIAEQMKNRKFSASSAGPTFVDFWLYEDLCILDSLQPELVYEISPKFDDFRKNMEELPGLSAAAKAAEVYPFNNVFANWKGGRLVR